MSSYLLELNNMGVNHLLQENTEAAIASFKEAVCQSRQLMPQHLCVPEPHCRSQSMTGTALAQSTFSRDPVFSPYNMFLVYERAFTLSPHADHVTFFAAVFFNLGLARHHLAMSHGEQSQINLQDALRCYNYGLRIIRKSLAGQGREELFVS
eukprot:scaffold2363_cov159-Amphora_coffeaeformis.AAC.45